MAFAPSQVAAHDTCRLCGERASLVSVRSVLRRYTVGYYQCPACDLIQTNRPFWLEEAYESALSAFDTGAIARTWLCADLTLSLAWLLRVGPRDRCVDYGGGHGILTRAMRDAGYDFRWHDPYAQNLFARGFEADPASRCALLTCFEVLEHLPDPREGLHALFAPAHDHLLVSTVLHRGHREDWWYYCPEAGQHVAFYSEPTMRVVADRFGYDAIVAPRYTLFSKPPLLRGWRRRLATVILRSATEVYRSPWQRLSRRLRPRHHPRTWEDHVELMRRNPPSPTRQEQAHAA